MVELLEHQPAGGREQKHRTEAEFGKKHFKE